MSLSLWTAALLTLAVFTYLWRDNPAWRFVEHLYLGLAVGYGIGYTWHNLLRPVLVVDVGRHGRWDYLLPLAIGALVYARHLKRWAWLARLPLALWVGYGAGYVVTYLPRTLLRQLAASFAAPGGVDGLVVLAALVGGLVYFSFTLPPSSRAVRGLSAVGRYALLLALGASFGSAVLYRFAILYGRVDFLLRTWLGL